MNRLSSYLLNPQNALGKWLNLPRKIHFFSYVLLIILVMIAPFWQWQTLSEKQHQLNVALQQEQNLQEKTRKLLQVLQQKTAETPLSPQLAAQIMPINQYIAQQFSARLQQENLHWEFASRPILHLTLHGYFIDLQRFINELIREFPTLAILQLRIVQDQDDEKGSIQSEISFEFQPIQH